jgi:N-acylneuraminate cytidylyltransferase
MVEVVAIIPARGGSKGAPGKNKRLVGGRPLINYTIAAAKAAPSLTRVIVSSDDPDIIALADHQGVETVLRPLSIAADDSPVIDAVRHALQATRPGNEPPAAVVLLQPTSPFRQPSDIDEAVRLFLKGGEKPVCSVCRCEDAHPARMYRIENEVLVSLMPELSAVRRQDLPAVYHRNGSIYVFGPPELASGDIIGPEMQPYVMGPASSVNIDTEIDLLLASAILERDRAGPDTGA